MKRSASSLQKNEESQQMVQANKEPRRLLYPAQLTAAMSIFLQNELKERKISGLGFLSMAEISCLYAVDNKTHVDSFVYSISKSNTYNIPSHFACYCPLMASVPMKDLYKMCLLFKVGPSPPCPLALLHENKTKYPNPAAAFSLLLYMQYISCIIPPRDSKEKNRNEDWWMRKLSHINKLQCFDFTVEDVRVHKIKEHKKDSTDDDNNKSYDIYNVTRYTRKWKFHPEVAEKYFHIRPDTPFNTPFIEYIWYDKCPCHNNKTCNINEDKEQQGPFYNFYGMMISSRIHHPAQDPDYKHHIFIQQNRRKHVFMNSCTRALRYLQYY